MIITHLIGGLGNQMFQYAAGRALALKNNQPLRLDIADFRSYALHNGFELERIFDCPVQIAAAGDMRGVLGWQSSPLVRRIVMRPALAPLRRRNFIIEPHFHYWPGINDAPPDCYLYGYWQSEKYFEDATAVIRGDFAFKTPLQGRNAELAAQIANANAVSLHVRRGDYVASPATNAVHGTCSPDYYRAAIQHVTGRMPQPAFFVFSDDPAWVRDNIKTGFPCVYVDHNRGADSFNDMRLMSLCRHHIIANSSFSWWGAWLNPRTDKIVVAPKHWFANKNDTRDLLPESWTAL